MNETVIEFRGVTKSYPGVKALDGIDLALQAGTVTALAGENGAGKSTFIKVLAGATRPDSGTVLVGGQEIGTTPRALIDAGVSVIYQELTDVPDMSVADNLMLGRPLHRAGLVRARANAAAASKALSRVGLGSLDTARPVRSLSPSERQLVEIARCLARDARVLVFDEPTSSLAESEVETLLEIIDKLRMDGLSVLYVSHHLDELFRIAGRVAVMRDGRLVADKPIGEWDEQTLVQTMLAKDLAHAYPWSPREPGEDRLVVEGLQAPGVGSVDLRAAAHEIVGLVGLAGAGRTELMKAVAGVVRPTSGRVVVGGRALRGGSIAAARRAGVSYASEDRKGEGLVLEASVEDNLSYGLYNQFSRLGIINRRRKARLAADRITEFGAKVESQARAVGRLSGGNQQKILLARVAAHAPTVVLLDDPTRGVDIGAKSSIHTHVLGLAERGAAVVLTSSDTDEVLAVADRVYVMRAGRIVGEVARAHFDRERILKLAAAG
ncbi:sugar ABC transporter ATP-binding protein [Microbacterium sp. NPDC078428]|uniref:sugar ABC transporter ATP-binding protein n=1 Tax=Microbacterium sp. NPDC078428 TaxID=3364190 RepID=UPI0037CB285A